MVRVLAAAMLTAAWSIPASVVAAPTDKSLKPHFSPAVAMDRSPTLRSLAANRVAPDADASVVSQRDRTLTRAESNGFAGTNALQTEVGRRRSPAPIANFEGLSNQDNFNVFGFRVNPPDPVGDVGPNHYVEMVNLVFAVYSKTGTLLLGPVDTGTLWAGFAGRRLHRPVRRPDRRLRPVRRPLDPDAVHDPRLVPTPATRSTTASRSRTTGDPTGAYYRYAFTTGLQLPRLPEVRRVDRLLRHHHARVRARRSSTASASTASRRTR